MLSAAGSFRAAQPEALSPLFRATNMAEEFVPVPSPLTTNFRDYWSFTAADLVVCSGALIVDSATDKLLLLRDAETGNLYLPWVRDKKQDISTFVKRPFAEIEEQTGLTLERIPYKKPWRLTKEMPNYLVPVTVIKPAVNIVTTDPFYISLGVIWDRHPDSKWYDTRQKITMWTLCRPTSPVDVQRAPANCELVWMTAPEALERLQAQGLFSRIDMLIVKQFQDIWKSVSQAS